MGSVLSFHSRRLSHATSIRAGHLFVWVKLAFVLASVACQVKITTEWFSWSTTGSVCFTWMWEFKFLYWTFFSSACFVSCVPLRTMHPSCCLQSWRAAMTVRTPRGSYTTWGLKSWWEEDVGHLVLLSVAFYFSNTTALATQNHSTEVCVCVCSSRWRW